MPKLSKKYGGEGDDGWKKHSLMLDGKRVKYDNVSDFQFSPDGKHVCLSSSLPRITTKEVLYPFLLLMGVKVRNTLLGPANSNT